MTENDVTPAFYARDGELAGAKIIRLATKKGANLIIMAAKKQSRILHAVVGETSDYVLKHAYGITVTVVPPALITRARLQRHDSDTSCPGDLTFGHQIHGLKFLKSPSRRLHLEPSALRVNNTIKEPENEITAENK